MANETDIRARAQGGLSRRHVLAGALTGGLAAVLPGAASSAAPASAAPQPEATQFFSDPVLNFEALFGLGAASYNAAQPGEVLEAFDRVHARGDTYAAYYDELLALGRRLHKLGDHAAHSGRRVTARNCYLRAATYLDQALFFTLASSTPTRAQQAAVYRETERCFAAAGAHFVPAFKRVAIPYAGRKLPGWLLTPAGPQIRRPTLILNNGSDAQNIVMLGSGGLGALERGWNALIFEGPGQGSNLFLHDLPFRPDWEKVITPIVTWLRNRPEVDKRRIALLGSSFAGYLVPRAASFEYRLAGVAVDPGAPNSFVAWQRDLTPQMLTWLEQGKRQEFNQYWARAQRFLTANTRFYVAKRVQVFGRASFYDQVRLASRFVLPASLARRIKAPTVIVQTALEQFYPGQSKQLYHWLHTTKSLINFTVAEGAGYHCEPMAPTVRSDAVLDWLDANLRPTG